jgi:hypothetical protein
MAIEPASLPPADVEDVEAAVSAIVLRPAPMWLNSADDEREGGTMLMTMPTRAVSLLPFTSSVEQDMLPPAMEADVEGVEAAASAFDPMPVPMSSNPADDEHEAGGMLMTVPAFAQPFLPSTPRGSSPSTCGAGNVTPFSLFSSP